MKKIIFYILGLFLPLIFLLGLLEGGLFVLQKVSGNWRFQVLNSSTLDKKILYPEDPESFLKIAIFGGSAAFGYNAERGFKEVLEYQFQKYDTEKKVFIRNFALPGYPFYKHQAELAKKALDYFDVILIYTGTNEAQNYLDESGYYRKPEFKSKISLEPVSFQIKQSKLVQVIQFLEHHSRIYAVFNRLNTKLFKKKNEINPYLRHEIVEFDRKRVLPEDEILKISANYEKSLREIGHLAKQKNKLVLVSNEATDDETPPAFSVIKEDVDRNRILYFFNEGLRQYHSKNYRAALLLFKDGLKLDSDVAVLNFYYGMSLLNLGKKQEARLHLRKSIDQDGLIIRAIGPLFDSAKKVSADNSEHIKFVDAAQFYTDLKNDRQIKSQELFSDLQHPTLLGHVVLGSLFFCELQNYTTSYCRDLKLFDFKGLEKELYSSLQISQDERSKKYFMKARWNISMASRTAYPDFFLNLADHYLNKFYELSDKSKLAEVDFLLYRFFILGEKTKLLTPEIQNEALVVLNKAYRLDPGYIENTFTINATPTGEESQSLLKRLHIDFNKADGKFALKE